MTSQIGKPKMVIAGMRTATGLVLLLFVTMSTGLTAAPKQSATGRSEWAAFLDEPTRANYERLAGLLRQCEAVECVRYRPGPGDVSRLSRLVQRDDALAVDVAFLTFKLLDGGELEDLLRAVATLSDRDPARFLRNLSAHHSSDDRIRDVTIMLPESTVDHVAKQRRALKRRRRALERVVTPASEERIRRVALRALERELAALPSDDG